MGGKQKKQSQKKRKEKQKRVNAYKQMIININNNYYEVL
jgi:hypothetical protein